MLPRITLHPRAQHESEPNMALCISSLLASLSTEGNVPDAATAAVLRSQATRANATSRLREVKKANHDGLLASVNGDKEKLTTIRLWAGRRVKRALFARAQDTKTWHEGGDRFLDKQFDTEETEYELVEIEVERARPPKEEVEFAKLQGRFQPHTPSIQGFFAPAPTVTTKVKPTDYYAPLGDFEWCEDPVSREEREQVYARNRKHAKPIRNIKDAQ